MHGVNRPAVLLCLEVPLWHSPAGRSLADRECEAVHNLAQTLISIHTIIDPQYSRV